MNSTFLKKIFKSDLFLSDYKKYLDRFEELADLENDKKIQKCVTAITDLVEKRKNDKIKTYKRLPWTQQWLKETKELAYKLLTYSDDQDLKSEDSDNEKSEKNKVEDQCDNERRENSNDSDLLISTKKKGFSSETMSTP